MHAALRQSRKKARAFWFICGRRRGIGLAADPRYKLQEEGLDTVEATRNSDTQLTCAITARRDRFFSI